MLILKDTTHSLKFKTTQFEEVKSYPIPDSRTLRELKDLVKTQEGNKDLVVRCISNWWEMHERSNQDNQWAEVGKKTKRKNKTNVRHRNNRSSGSERRTRRSAKSSFSNSEPTKVQTRVRTNKVVRRSTKHVDKDTKVRSFVSAKVKSTRSTNKAWPRPSAKKKSLPSKDTKSAPVVRQDKPFVKKTITTTTTTTTTMTKTVTSSSAGVWGKKSLIKVIREKQQGKEKQQVETQQKSRSSNSSVVEKKRKKKKRRNRNKKSAAKVQEQPLNVKIQPPATTTTTTTPSLKTTPPTSPLQQMSLTSTTKTPLKSPGSPDHINLGKWDKPEST